MDMENYRLGWDELSSSFYIYKHRKGKPEVALSKKNVTSDVWALLIEQAIGVGYERIITAGRKRYGIRVIELNEDGSPKENI